MHCTFLEIAICQNVFFLHFIKCDKINLYISHDVVECSDFFFITVNYMQVLFTATIYRLRYRQAFLFQN